MTTKLPNSLLQTPGGGSGGIPDAPDDGGRYIRQAEGWADLDPTLDTLQNEIDGKAAVDHEHPVAAAPEGRLLVSEASDEATFRPPSEVWPLLLPEVPVANFSPGLILGSDTDGGLIGLTPEQVHERALRVIEGGAVGLDASGDLALTWTPGLAGWRRRAVGNITLTGFPGLSESSGKQRFIFRQDATGGRGLTIGPGIILKNDADVSLDAGQETAFDVFAVGSKIYIERVTPVVPPSFTHTLTIASPAAGQAGFGTGYGSISPNTIGVTSMLYFYASTAVPRVRMQFVGAAMPYTSMQVRFDDGSGLFRDFVVLPSDRYGMPGTDPAAATVSDWLLGRVGQSVQMEIIPT